MSEKYLMFFIKHLTLLAFVILVIVWITCWFFGATDAVHALSYLILGWILISVIDYFRGK